MRSPMIKRIPREFRQNIGRYTAMILLLTMAIAITSAFLVSAASMEHMAKSMYETYTIEDAHITAHFPLEASDFETIESHDAAVYENFSKDISLSFEVRDKEGKTSNKKATARIFVNRNDINKAIYTSGQAPSSDDEIALSRVFCANNNLTVGDKVVLGKRDFIISGIMTLADASTTFIEPGDFIFNTVSFDFAQVTQEAFDSFPNEAVAYNYSIVFNSRDMPDKTRIEKENDIITSLTEAGIVVTDVQDWYSNKSINYALEDIQGDRTMWMTLVIILFIIIAFVFVILTNATIESQSSSLGTLLANGYKKWELVRHYMAIPLIIGLVSAVLGNVLGRFWLIDYMKGLYYNSYNLPPYEQFWDSFVFVETTIFPVSVLLVISFVGLVLALRHRPLQFLRHETALTRNKAALVLPQKIPFSTRFRLRIFTKNWMRFLTLFIGIMFGSLLLVFGFCLLPTMDYNADQMSKNLLAEHTYILKTPVEIDVTEDERAAYAAAERLTFEEASSLAPDELMSLMQKAAAVDADTYMKNTLFNNKEVIQGAEKIATTSLLIDKPRSNTAEEITVYGIEETSKYKDIEIAHNKVVAGLGFVDKLGIQVGQRVTLYNKMSGDEYSFVIDGTTGNKNDMNIYISRSYFNTVFDNDDTWFNGYISNDPLNITKHYVATEITPASMKRISEQMHDSMGNMIYLLVLVSLPIYFVLIYLLTKIVIDKNARYISYMKVFGYRNSEINTLYIRSISATVIASLIISIPVLIVLVKWIIGIAMYNYSGNFVVSTPLNELLKVALLGIITYAVVAFFHIRAIKRIPLSLAMKTYE